MLLHVIDVSSYMGRRPQWVGGQDDQGLGRTAAQSVPVGGQVIAEGLPLAGWRVLPGIVISAQPQMPPWPCIPHAEYAPAHHGSLFHQMSGSGALSAHRSHGHWRVAGQTSGGLAGSEASQNVQVSPLSKPTPWSSVHNAMHVLGPAGKRPTPARGGGGGGGTILSSLRVIQVIQGHDP